MQVGTFCEHASSHARNNVIKLCSLLLPCFLSTADLQFLDGFTGQVQIPNAVAAPNQNAVLGQPLDSFQTLPPVGMAPLPHQQPAMPMQMAAAPLTLQQQYTQAILQQHMMAAQMATTVQTGITPAAAPGVSRRGKSAAEVAEQQERIKERRRESAQRSRQRKSAYMKSLEGENHALKLDNERLRKELARLSGRAVPSSHPSQMFSAVGTTSGSSAEAPHAHDDYSSDPFGESDLCPAVGGCESGGVANEFLVMTMWTTTNAQ